MRYVIFGFGSIGRRHARVIERVLGCKRESIFIAELNEARLQEANEQGYSSFEAQMNLEFDIAVIASSTSTHLKVLENLRLPRRLLYIEKPISHRIDGIAKIVRTIDEKKSDGLNVCVGYMLRHHPAVQLVKRILDQGRLGKILKYRAECGMYLPNWHPWEDYRSFYMSKIDGGGGALLDISHEIDLVSYLAGSRVQSVCGKFGNLSELECSSDDFAEFILLHQSGIIGSIGLDLIQKQTFRKTKLVLEKGEIEIDFVNKTMSVTTDIDVREEHVFSLDPDDLYVAQYRDALADSIVSCSANEGIDVLQIIEGIRLSSTMNSFVNLPLYSG